VAATVPTRVSLNGNVKDDEKCGTCSTQWREVKYLKNCQKSVKKERFGELGCGWEDIIKMVVNNYGMMICSGFVWLRIWSYGCCGYVK
jgi:hypothetical protein